MTQEALKLALEALELAHPRFGIATEKHKQAITAIKKALREHAMREVQRLGQEIEQEPVMILPDGSAFGVMSFPLPDDHWLYAPNEYKDGEYEPIDLPKPILTHALRDAVVAAVRYAVRGATMRGQETDFDPDALVQNAVYALCGPYVTPPQRTEQEPVAWKLMPRDATDAMLKAMDECSTEGYDERLYAGHAASVYMAAWDEAPETISKSKWVGLTEEEHTQIAIDAGCMSADWVFYGAAVERKLREKNTHD
jgi:hypothetical protein